MSAIPPTATKFCSPAKCREGPISDIEPNHSINRRRGPRGPATPRKPRALAVFVLIANSNLLGPAPVARPAFRLFKMRSTKPAACFAVAFHYGFAGGRCATSAPIFSASSLMQRCRNRRCHHAVLQQARIACNPAGNISGVTLWRGRKKADEALDRFYRCRHLEIVTQLQALTKVQRLG